MTPTELVLRFLDSIGRPAEARYYLDLFRAANPESFAVIAVDDDVVDDGADALALDLRYLALLGLTPVIVFGVLAPARAAEHATLIRDALAPGVTAAVVDAGAARETARAGTLPLIAWSPAAHPDEHARLDALAALAAQLGSRKVVLVGELGGLAPPGEARRSLVDVTVESDELARALPAAQARALARGCRVLDGLPRRATVSITSPLDLLRELFTTRGAGTLLRRGSAVARHDGFAGVDRAQLSTLIERAFGRGLVAGFYERPARAVYVADDYRGAAIVLDTEVAPYLSKFAVDREARGEGIGRDLWRALAHDLPSLFWRSRADNSVGAWYRDQCDGMMRAGAWWVFWRGLAPEEVPAAVAWASRAPVDFDR